ncbi:hypothetical protein BDV33DRAFT_170361 [Aspergillus novoparasiticus]|uniref:Uncharacterized protein n=1 Tax=Aspergillus novoparasiticus TaxID=986946 RepID=A0A5N6EVJ7_9EURO|nr:hypothetical protein BDV33DRAFT_170361 [Aspergillus novoparasiticus]
MAPVRGRKKGKTFPGPRTQESGAYPCLAFSLVEISACGSYVGFAWSGWKGFGGK